MKPQEIESLSFRIIDDEAGDHGFDSRHWQIVRRMIHTSADFDYGQTVRFHPKAVDAGVAAIRAGTPVLTDTRMALSGIRKSIIEQFGGTVECLIDDPGVMREATQSGTTRARAAVDAGVARTPNAIFVIGNAPTALLRLMEQVANRNADPALIVGLPVGFVNAAESKSELLQLERPYITNVGRKGGSNVAASVINALCILALTEGRT